MREEVLCKLKSTLGDKDALDEETCISLLRAAGCGDNIIRHSRAVAKKAAELAAGLPLNSELIGSAALLHDIARKEKNHAYEGYLYLRELGFEDAAEIVRQHELLDEEGISEAAVVYLADKYTFEDRYVSLDERFESSSLKCTTPEAVEAHRRKYNQAKAVEKLITA